MSSPTYRKIFICRACKENLLEEDVKECSACHRAIYCSRECQVNDWKDGHKLDCKHMKTSYLKELELGNSRKEAKKALVSEQNLSYSSEVLISENIESILFQSTFLKVNVIDCLVELNFCQIPPKIRVITPEKQDMFLNIYGCDVEITTRIIKRNHEDDALTFVCIANQEDGRTSLIKTIPQKAAELLLGRDLINEVSACTEASKWALAQRTVESDIGTMLDTITSDEKLCKHVIKKLSLPQENVINYLSNIVEEWGE